MISFSKYKSYIKDNPKGYWFKRRLYGWGWVPAKWQGWCTLIVYICLILSIAFTIDESSTMNDLAFTFILPFILLTTTFILISYKKGEPPKWMWGPESNKRGETKKN